MAQETVVGESGRSADTLSTWVMENPMQANETTHEESTDRCSTCGRAHEHGKWLTALLGDKCALCVFESNGDINHNSPPMLADGGSR